MYLVIICANVDRELDNVGYYSVMLFVEQMGLVV